MATIKEKAIAWLEGETKDYQEGLNLVREITLNKGLLSSLDAKRNDRHLDKINYLLSQYCSAEYKVLAVVADITPQPEKAIKVLPLNPNDARQLEADDFVKKLPVGVQELVANKKRLFNERNIRSQKITDLTDNVEADQQIPFEVEELVKEVLNIDEDIKAIDSQLAFFFATGAMAQLRKADPQVSDLETETMESIEKKINNKKSQVSKAKKASELKPDDVAKAEKFAKMELELKDLIFQKETMKQNAVAASTVKSD
jgi:hypothetical protein